MAAADAADVGRNIRGSKRRPLSMRLTPRSNAPKPGMKKFTDGAMKRIKAFAASVKTAAGDIADALRKLIETEMPELEMGIDEANARKALAGFANTVGQSRGEIAGRIPAARALRRHRVRRDIAR